MAEEGTVRKNTIFVGGVTEETDEAALYELFSTFGDIIDVQLPSSATNPALAAEAKHRGFAFLTFTQAMDAQDAIDNMDMNEFRGKVLKVSIAKPQKIPLQGLGNRPVWESEEWLQAYGKNHSNKRPGLLDKGGGDEGGDGEETEKNNDAMEE